MSHLQFPLQVHVAWHGREPDCLGAKLAQELFRRLQRREVGSRCSEIPVWFAGLDTPDAPRARPVLDDAKHNVLVPVVDTAMYQARLRGWQECLEHFAHDPAPGTGQRLILPIAATTAAPRLSPILLKTNAIPAQEGNEPRDIGLIAQDIEVVLAQVLALPDAPPQPAVLPALPTIFLSHAKRDEDGKEVAQQLRNHFFHETQLNTFFDRNNLPYGSDFEVCLKQKISESFVVVILTDHYADSRWCRMELVWALQANRPVVVIDCIREGTARLLPTLSGFPLVRWNGGNNSAAAVARVIVDEHLRDISQRALIRAVTRAVHLDKDRVGIHAVPPTLASIIAVRGQMASTGQTPTLHIYPDPPMPREELDLLTAMNAHAQTTTQLLAYGPTGNTGSESRPLARTRVVFSTSNDPELELRGMSSDHIDELLDGLARHLFVLGASFATGGDYRSNGFVDRLLNAARQYEPGSDVQLRFQSHIVWPIHRAWSEKDHEERDKRVDLVLQEPPEGQGSSREGTPREWTEALTRMRRALIEHASCLIIICGKRFGFRGRYPGVLEEAALAVEKQIPVYLVAGLGGVASDVWQVIEAGASAQTHSPAVFDLQQHIEKTEGYADLVKALSNEPGLRPDFAGVKAELARLGLAGLSRINGLTEEENRRLATSRSFLEIQALVAKGIAQLAASQAGSCVPT